MEFVSTYGRKELQAFGDFGCGLIGLGETSQLRLRKIRFDGLSFVDTKTGDEVTQASHVFSLDGELFAVTEN